VSLGGDSIVLPLTEGSALVTHYQEPFPRLEGNATSDVQQTSGEVATRPVEGGEVFALRCEP